MVIKEALNNISIRAKIYTMTGTLIVALTISIYYSLVSIHGIGIQLAGVANNDIPLTQIVSNVTISEFEQSLSYERALRFGQEMNQDKAAASQFKVAVNKFEGSSASIKEEFSKGLAIVSTELAAAKSKQAAAKFKLIGDDLKLVQQEHINFAQAVKQALLLITNGKLQEALASASKIQKMQSSLNETRDGLLNKIEKSTEAASIAAEDHEQSANHTLVLIAAITAIITVLIFSVVITGVSRLVKGLSRALSVAENIADGNLTEKVASDGNDEIGKLLAALSTMREKLHDMIMQMNQSSNELSTASEELASVSEDSNRGIHQQQSEIQQVATAMNEMTATVQEVASNAQLTSQSANEANSQAQKGKHVVDTAVSSIQSLSEVVENAATVIQQVGKDSDDIGAVLDVIKGIAEQTNLLALNAAIEAARAGEQGRGFAVVADEVRTLAKRTQDSTSEIEAMITRLQESSRNAVSTMDTGRKQALSSVSQAREAGTSLEAINDVVGRISNMNTQIASAAEEQTSVAEEVNQNVVVISQISEQNAAAVNQITASSEELSRMAISLQEMISQFSV